LAIVGLHGNTFKPHTGTKTSVMFLQKWNNDPKAGALCKKVDDYPIFYATQQSRGKDNSGDKLYVADEGTETTEPKEAKQDKLGHFIISHDLFNHNKFIIEKGFEMQVDYTDKDGNVYKKGQALECDLVIDQGETSDGIAEAFFEFLREEKLSFVGK
jgi:type I restriction enzyme M protein